MPTVANHPILAELGGSAADGAVRALLLLSGAGFLSQRLEGVAQVVDAGPVIKAPFAVRGRGFLLLQLLERSISCTVLGEISTAAPICCAMSRWSAIGRSCGFFFGPHL